jgi:hypothetical protein
MSSSTVAAWIAHVAFGVLLAAGLVSGELGARATGVVLTLWVAAYISSSFIPYGAALFPSVVAVLDVVLVLLILKADVRIS